MKTRGYWNRISHGALMFATLLGGILVVPAGHAESPGQKVDNRFLFIFDTSSDMKRRVPAVQRAVAALLATSASGQIRSNDSLGVWTFDQELHTGQFPLQLWQPDNSALIISNLNVFVGQQSYSKQTGFDTLVPPLNQVVQSSERLTVVIVCDGNGDIHGTPYDVGINQIFQQRQAERQKARLPIAIAIRSQLGHYVDCIVSFPPQPVSLPVFPPMPEAPAPPKIVPTPPRVVVPPLIIIGTPPTNRPPPTNPPALKPPAPTPPPATIAPPPAPAAAAESGPLLVAPVKPPGNGPIQLTIDTALLSRTNAVAPPAEDSRINRMGALAAGIGFLAVAAGLTVFLFRRARSMKKD